MGARKNNEIKECLGAKLPNMGAKNNDRSNTNILFTKL
jgi:hypothetical protein